MMAAAVVPCFCSPRTSCCSCFNNEVLLEEVANGALIDCDGGWGGRMVTSREGTACGTFGGESGREMAGSMPVMRCLKPRADTDGILLLARVLLLGRCNNGSSST